MLLLRMDCFLVVSIRIFQNVYKNLKTATWKYLIIKLSLSWKPFGSLKKVLVYVFILVWHLKQACIFKFMISSTFGPKGPMFPSRSRTFVHFLRIISEAPFVKIVKLPSLFLIMVDMDFRAELNVNT